MTLTRRVTWMVASAVALAVTLTAAASYVAVTLQLRSQIDRELRLQATTVQRMFAANPLLRERMLNPAGARIAQVLPTLSARDGGPLGTLQYLPRSGPPQLLVPAGGRGPGVDQRERQVAAGRRPEVWRVSDETGERLRLITVQIDQAGAVQIGKSLSTVDIVARQLLILLLVIGVGGVGTGVLVTRRVTARATAPVRELAEAAERIARTDDLSLRIPASADDELGQLARRFNAMLDALQLSRRELAGSVAAQQQLVADASHELRTPITALRTNLEVLLETDDAHDRERRAILTALTAQVGELSQLVADVIEVARGEAAAVDTDEPVDLVALVEHELQRARLHYPEVDYRLEARPTVLAGAPDRLARAVANLLDNAAKHGGNDGHVTIRVDERGVVVRDTGPGIAPDDLPHVFDRFYRGADARQVPGSGLGLSIVQQVAAHHGGSVVASNHPDGGAVIHLDLTAPISLATRQGRPPIDG